MINVEKKNWHWIRAEDGILGGVCLGFARQFELSPLLVRIVWLMSVMFFGTGLALYVACLIALPRSDKLPQAHEKMVMGVCARIGQRGDIEVGLARLIALFLLCSTFGAAIVGYIVLHFVLSPSNKSIV